ncbi:MAG: PAS domain S-box-containing protein [Oceanospirillaceae bacterium]|jgi:PAS domain S-box-containing protein
MQASNTEPVNTSQDAICNYKLQSEHKRAIDAASIVSKTDFQGIIFYVNYNFCQTSGYTSSELIGKNHNIINHPDMTRHTFKEMWNRVLTNTADFIENQLVDK